MDKLSHIIIKAVEDGNWKGIKAGRSGLMISHLMFADDLLLFGEATETQMKCVLDNLNLFCHMLGRILAKRKLACCSLVMWKEA
jgi:hypothetical protein